MNTLHFIRPEWLFLLVPGLLVVWLIHRHRERIAGVWAKLVDPALQPYVLTGGDKGKASRWPGLIAAVSLILVTIALSGPAWQRIEVPASRSGDAMIILLDLSRSMDATDIAPSRLERARLKLQDVLRERRGGETGLVVFSANAFVVTPLTEDVDTIGLLVPTLTTDLMPSRGSYPEAAIAKAVQLFEQAGVNEGRILLITDGGNMPPAMRATREARASGHRLSVLAVGTAEGGPIPQKRGGFVTDSRGSMAIPKMSASELAGLASAGDGKFAVLSNDGRDLKALNVASRDGGMAIDSTGSQSIERWADIGAWLLIPVVLLASFAFRRGGFAFAGVCLICLLPARPASAFGWDDLWQNKNQQAAELLRDGDAESAAETFKDPAWQATAKYSAGDYAESASQFAGLDGADARYNSGNALARKGDYAAAIEAYKETLVMQPDHEDAKFNLDLLEQLQQNNEQSENQDGEGSDEQQDGEQQPGQPSDEEQSGDSQSEQDQEGGQPSDSEESQESGAKVGDEEQQQKDIEALQKEFREAQAEPDGEQSEQRVPMTEEERQRAEQEQALEQWLRRVPDDPGGLLRRKFRSQYQRRQLDQDGNRLWPDDRNEPW